MNTTTTTTNGLTCTRSTSTNGFTWTNITTIKVDLLGQIEIAITGSLAQTLTLMGLLEQTLPLMSFLGEALLDVTGLLE